MSGYVWMKWADQTFAVVAPDGEVVGQWDHIEAAQQHANELNNVHRALVFGHFPGMSNDEIDDWHS